MSAEQHARDSAELRRLCAERDALKKERDTRQATIDHLRADGERSEAHRNDLMDTLVSLRTERDFLCSAVEEQRRTIEALRNRLEQEHQARLNVSVMRAEMAAEIERLRADAAIGAEFRSVFSHLGMSPDTAGNEIIALRARIAEAEGQAPVGVAVKTRHRNATAATFDALEVPHGTKLYTLPIPAPAAGAPKWQPIETAPKDGSLVMLWEQFEDEPFFGRWNDFRGRWYASTTHYDTDGNACVVDKIYSDGVTHWMPLPAAPQPGEQREGV